MDLVSWTFSSEPADIDRPLLIDSSNTSRSVSYRECRSYVKKLVSGLHANGIQVGDAVCLSGFNDILYGVLYLGIVGAGARFTGTNPAYTVPEFVHHLRITNTKALIVEPKLLDKALAAASEVGIPTSRVYVLDIHESNPREDLSSWNRLLEHGEKNWVEVSDPANTVASITSTSGTSGLPKGALLPHSYHVTQAQMRRSGPELPYEVRRLTALPPFHVFATPIVPASIHEGHPTYIMRRYDLQHFVECIEKYQISETWIPPPVLVGIPQSPLATKSVMRSIKQIWMGGAGVGYANQLPMYNLLSPEARVYQVWGMTECGWITTTQWPEKLEDDSVGKPLPGFELRVVDDDDEELTEPGAVGNLLIRSPHLMMGYIGNEKATIESFAADGWLRSGDVGYILDGKAYVIDRAKELLKVRGWQVSPAEVEGALLQHPHVMDAALVGVPALDTEIPRAYIVLAENTTMSQDELKAFAAKRLAKYKIPDEIVFTDSIPKNSTGKILRRVLRERVAAEMQKEATVTTEPLPSDRSTRSSTGTKASSWQVSITMIVNSSRAFSKAMLAIFSRLRRAFKV